MSALKLPTSISRVLARRDIRTHHYLWHQVRSMWLFYDADTQRQIRELGWEPPRPSRRPGTNGGDPRPFYGNGSGEDFLHMHAQMMTFIGANLVDGADDESSRHSAWRTLPSPRDSSCPVPPAWDTGDRVLDERLVEVKSDGFFNDCMLKWERDLTGEKTLRGMSLGELGARIEFLIYNTAHVRWCARIDEIRPDFDPAKPHYVSPRWDEPSYDWLGDIYSSHVNPLFLEIHNWVETRVDAWKMVNCRDTPLTWRGAWAGKIPEHPTPTSLHALLTSSPDRRPSPCGAATNDYGSSMLSELLRVVSASGKFAHYYDKLDA